MLLIKCLQAFELMQLGTELSAAILASRARKMEEHCTCFDQLATSRFVGAGTAINDCIVCFSCSVDSRAASNPQR